jgi:flavin reductase (DIM6/NTAB) family NADH-FMN oxidoreductase RutF
MTSGNKQSKKDFFAWTAGEAGAPTIDDAKLVMECNVEDIYNTKGFDNFICAIANTYADEQILNENEKPGLLPDIPEICCMHQCSGI